MFAEYPLHWMHTDTGNSTSCNLNPPAWFLEGEQVCLSCVVA